LKAALALFVKKLKRKCLEFIRRTAFAESEKRFQEFDRASFVQSEQQIRKKDPVSVRKEDQNQR
jgi:hypothetical protein